MRSFTVLMLFIFTLTSQAAPELQGSVNTVHSLGTAPRTFIILPTTEQQTNAEFTLYAALIRQQLIAKGWTERAFDQAELSVYLQYDVRAEKSLEIVTTSTRPGNPNLDWGFAIFVEKIPQFAFDVRMTIYSIAAYRTSSVASKVYEGQIYTVGNVSRMPAAMPALVSNLFAEFPGVGKDARFVRIKLPDNVIASN